jgi:signal transduction histidine kinase
MRGPGHGAPALRVRHDLEVGRLATGDAAPAPAGHPGHPTPRADTTPGPDDAPPLPRPPISPEQRLEQLARVLANAAAGDFSEKLELPEAETCVEDRVAILARFLLDDLERAQEARTRDVERLREIDQMKGRFINTAAHELGTPLTPLRMQIHLLQEGKCGPLTPQQDRAVKILARNIDRVVLLVGDLNAISRMEAGELKLRKAPLDLAALVHETYESFVDGAAQRGLGLDLQVDGGLWVDGDPARLGQVLYNLTTNALKFTPRGGKVVLRARLRGKEALVEVQDSGIGLSADDIARLAQPFVKLTDIGPHGDAGTGLGLYISKGLVERHGGLLWVSSPGPGRGTTVSFAVPLREVPTPISETVASRLHEAAVDATSLRTPD